MVLSPITLLQTGRYTTKSAKKHTIRPDKEQREKVSSCRVQVMRCRCGCNRYAGEWERGNRWESTGAGGVAGWGTEFVTQPPGHFFLTLSHFCFKIYYFNNEHLLAMYNGFLQLFCLYFAISVWNKDFRFLYLFLQLLHHYVAILLGICELWTQ